MVLAGAAALLDSVWLVAFHPSGAALILSINGSIAVVALGGYAAIGTIARRQPEAVVFVVLIAVDVATIALALGHPPLVLVSAGYVLLLPTVVSLVIPWATRIHIVWLGMHAALVLGYAFVTPDASVPPGAKDELIGLLIVAIAVSQYGHLANLRAQVRSFSQIERIRALNRQGRRDQTRVDRLNATLEQTANTDAMTGLGNRTALKSALKVIRSRIERHGEMYGILMLDLDRFKAINDKLGHLHGDDVLRSAVDAMTRVLRPGDAAFRYGGEEFLVLMRLTSPGEALVAAERIRRSTDGLRIPNAANTPYGHLTMSVGFTTVERADLPADDETWLARADGALYRAKANGRNRCEMATEPRPRALRAPSPTASGDFSAGPRDAVLPQYFDEQHPGVADPDHDPAE